MGGHRWSIDIRRKKRQSTLARLMQRMMIMIIEKHLIMHTLQLLLTLKYLLI
jgi:hypothetical protein